jgi:hypothetical protein
LWGLAVEDDRTLRWRQGSDGEFVYLDLRVPRVVDGCPRRERFRPLLSDAHVLVTSTDYGAATVIDGIVWTVVRACLRAGATSSSRKTSRRRAASPPPC